MAAAAFNTLLNTIVEQRVVRQAGELVVTLVVFQFGRDLGRDILEFRDAVLQIFDLRFRCYCFRFFGRGMTFFHD